MIKLLTKIKGEFILTCGAMGLILSIVVGGVLYWWYGSSDVYKDSNYYNDVCWLTSHNSFAHPIPTQSTVDAMLSRNILPNQTLTIEQQLESGVRSFMIDLHLDGGGNIIIAHGGVLFKQPLSPFLDTIKNWLDNHSKDIITIHFESYVGDYTKLINTLNSVGLAPYLFNLSSGTSWPTLGDMRKKNERLVIFSDNAKDVGHNIMFTKEYMETDYNLIRSPNCEMRYDKRANPYAVPAPVLFVMNHFYPLTIISGSYGINFDDKFPYITGSFIKSINKYEDMLSRVCSCFKQFNKWPNFVTVDFVAASGQESKIVSDINHNRIICPP